jgi:hypothetical protein
MHSCVPIWIVSTGSGYIEVADTPLQECHGLMYHEGYFILVAKVMPEFQKVCCIIRCIGGAWN